MKVMSQSDGGASHPSDTNAGDTSRVAQASAERKLVCQADGCGKDLTGDKVYYQRHRTCAVHLRELSVEVGGQACRFCQQCARFHPVDHFDGTKRSCRTRLMQHNARRRCKPDPTIDIKTESDSAGGADCLDLASREDSFYPGRRPMRAAAVAAASTVAALAALDRPGASQRNRIRSDANSPAPPFRSNSQPLPSTTNHNEELHLSNADEDMILLEFLGNNNNPTANHTAHEDSHATITTSTGNESRMLSGMPPPTHRPPTNSTSGRDSPTLHGLPAIGTTSQDHMIPAHLRLQQSRKRPGGPWDCSPRSDPGSFTAPGFLQFSTSEHIPQMGSSPGMAHSSGGTISPGRPPHVPTPRTTLIAASHRLRSTSFTSAMPLNPASLLQQNNTHHQGNSNNTWQVTPSSTSTDVSLSFLPQQSQHQQLQLQLQHNDWGSDIVTRNPSSSTKHDGPEAEWLLPMTDRLGLGEDMNDERPAVRQRSTEGLPVVPVGRLLSAPLLLFKSEQQDLINSITGLNTGSNSNSNRWDGSALGGLGTVDQGLSISADPSGWMGPEQIQATLDEISTTRRVGSSTSSGMQQICAPLSYNATGGAWVTNGGCGTNTGLATGPSSGNHNSNQDLGHTPSDMSGWSTAPAIFQVGSNPGDNNTMIQAWADQQAKQLRPQLQQQPQQLQLHNGTGSVMVRAIPQQMTWVANTSGPASAPAQTTHALISNTATTNINTSMPSSTMVNFQNLATATRSMPSGPQTGALLSWQNCSTQAQITNTTSSMMAVPSMMTTTMATTNTPAAAAAAAAAATAPHTQQDLTQLEGMVPMRVQQVASHQIQVASFPNKVTLSTSDGGGSAQGMIQTIQGVPTSQSQMQQNTPAPQDMGMAMQQQTQSQQVVQVQQMSTLIASMAAQQNGLGSVMAQMQAQAQPQPVQQQQQQPQQQQAQASNPPQQLPTDKPEGDSMLAAISLRVANCLPHELPPDLYNRLLNLVATMDGTKLQALLQEQVCTIGF